jgi:hypothetical protein
MRRRIERSRARCEKTSAEHGNDRARPQNAPQQPSPPSQDGRDDS